MSFEQNSGQFDTSVRFVARGPSYSLGLHKNEITLSLQKQEADGTRSNDNIMTRFAGAHDTDAMAEDRLPGKVNYLIGNDPQQWKTNVPTYQRVRYHELYPGIDLVYYGNQQQLEYDFVIAPGANPKDITLQLEGAKRVTIDATGALHLVLPHGEVVWKEPQTYQMDGDRRIPILSKFVLDGSELHFQVERYDRGRALIIDPVLTYATYLGNIGQDTFNRIAADSAGNAYITGQTGSGWPTTAGSLQSTYAGGMTDAFVTKINAAGTALVYSTYIGGNDQDSGSAIAVDRNGSAYVTGDTVSANFPHTAGAFQSPHSQSSWRFLLKLNASGSSLDYSAWLPSITTNAVAVDPSGNAFFTGGVFDPNGDPVPATPGAFRTSHGDLSGCQNVGGASYVWEMNSSGSAPVYVTYLSDCEVGNGIALDPQGNAYITGITAGRHFLTPGAFQSAFGGYIDAYVTKINSSGSAAVYSSYYGGTADNEGYGIAVDPAGEAMIAGRTNAANLPVVNAFQSTNPGGLGNMQAFVAKFNSTGSNLVYGTYLGGSNQELANGIATDTSGRAFVTGEGSSYDFPTKNAFQGICGTEANFKANNACTTTAFVTAFNPDGTLLYSSWLGPKTTFSDGTGIAADASGNAYITGITGAGFPTTPGAFQTQFNGNSSQETGFVAKISPQQTQGCTLNRTKPSITICEPLQGQTVTSPVHISALANDTATVVAIQVYVDGTYWFADEGPAIMDAAIDVPAGSHVITVKGWNAAGNSYLAAVSITVSGNSAGQSCEFPTNLPSIRVCNPLSGSTVPAGGMHVTAKGNSDEDPVTAMRLYIDNQEVDTVFTNTLDTTVPLSPGPHFVVVQGWDWTGQIFKEDSFVTAK